MGWPYKFLDLTREEVQIRRQTLDRYGSYAQFSALTPIILALLVRLFGYLRQRWQASAAYDAVPHSPNLKARRQSWVGNLDSNVRKVKWWLGDDVYFMGQHWGQKDQWVFGVGWFAWLLVLSVLETGEDYLHLTKRFGIVAVSQIPFQYLLALKSFSPIGKVFRTSHEELNKWHRVLSRVTLSLLVLHAIFYMNFFVLKGIVFKRLFAPIVFLGVVAFATMNMMTSTAAAAVRKYSYRVFFITHLIGAFAIPPLVFFHAKSSRLFMAEAIIVFLIDLVVRRLRTVMAFSKLESIPGTNLIRIQASIPQFKVNAFRSRPGSHIYLSIPAAARPAGGGPTSSEALLYEFLFNPFTVASVDEETRDLTLVARELDGPLTRRLGYFANAGAGMDDGKIPLCIEGPYGAASIHFEKLISSTVDRVLLVAGGVGATFTVPIYQAIIQDNPSAKVEMVWSVRGAGDATWAMSTDKSPKSLLDDSNVHIFLTGDSLSSGNTGPMAGMPAETNPEGEIEMSPMDRDRRRNLFSSDHDRKRPNLRNIVDDFFRQGAEERVAVLVCGPAEMGREMREYVGAWVMRGREVVWHNEAFGW